MDQRDLRALEEKCIQEEAPVCKARCPIHVDVRGFLKKIAQGSPDEAFHILASTMPFPGIVGRICDHPCQNVCKRYERGGAIAVAELERVLVSSGRRVKDPIILPRKSRHVGITGGGLSSLTAALDLVRKGYEVTLFEPGKYPGEALSGAFGDRLSADVVQEELGTLVKAGVHIRLSEALDFHDLMKGSMAGFDALCIGVDLSLPDIGEKITIDVATLQVEKRGLFIAGLCDDDNGHSPIAAVADGRRAAVSIDRYLQGVSLTAGREREGPYETRLFVSLESVASAPVVAMKGQVYTGEEARQEAQRCIQCECMECVKVCLYLEQFKFYPKRYVRQISNDATMVMGSHGATNKLVNSCSLCGLCEMVCPHHLPMQEVCIEARRGMVGRGKMPPSAHDLALEFMRAGNDLKATLALHGPGHDRSRYAFFPGCNLAAIYPEHVLSSYAWLLNHLKGGTGFILRCCGVPAKWAGRDDLFQGALNALREDWHNLGEPIMVAACPTCCKTFREDLPGMKFITLWELLAEEKWEAKAQGKTFAVHDPCTARYDEKLQESVRRLLTVIGASPQELLLGREMTECCGFGGLMSAANPPLAKDVARKRGQRSDAAYVTYCAMCRNALAATGKDVLHVLDLVFASTDDLINLPTASNGVSEEWRAYHPLPGPLPQGRGENGYPVASNGESSIGLTRKPIGYSDRCENRYHLREELLKTLWGKEGRAMEPYEKIILHIADEVMDRLEERRILREDLQRVIENAERTGEKFFNPMTERWLASLKPAHVTYWVEYSAEGDGFRVHSAYYHRMEVV